MPQIVVNVFNGTGPQVPTTYQVDGDIYQDIVSILINSGLESGQIYGLQGESIDYNAPISLNEVNYIIPLGGFQGKLVGNIVALGGRKIEINYNSKGIYRDIYNAFVAKGVSLGSQILYKGKPVSLDSLISKFPPHMQNDLYVIPPVENRQPQRPPTTNYTIRTGTGEISMKIIPGVTTARDILQAINPNNNGMKLARVTIGDYNAYIYGDNEQLGELPPYSQLYIVPDYETVFSGYSRSLTS